jgi:hypothetical protein
VPAPAVAPGGFPVIAPPPPDARGKTRTYLVVGLACAAVVLCVGLTGRHHLLLDLRRHLELPRQSRQRLPHLRDQLLL